MTEIERFWGYVDQLGGPDACWLWTASVTTQRGGYGQFNVAGGRVVRAHRMAYELLRGPIPAGLHLDHLCRRPPCVNPAHLEPVTQAENTRRGNAPSAIAARRNECIAGHPREGRHLYVRPNGDRDCRTCSNERQRERRAQK